MNNRKLLRAAAALLLVGVVGVASVGCSFSLEQPNWVTQALCEHVFDEEEVLKEATCTEDGRVMKVCSDCGKTKITTVKATGHDVVEDEAVDATCTTPGLTAGSHCTACGEVLVKQEEVAGGHTYGEWIVVQAADTHQDGLNTRTCTVCGFEEEQFVLGDHQAGIGESEVVLEPTCISHGYSSQYCVLCGGGCTYEQIPALSTGQTHLGTISDDGICSYCNSKDFSTAKITAIEDEDEIVEGWYRVNYSAYFDQKKSIGSCFFPLQISLNGCRLLNDSEGLWFRQNEISFFYNPFGGQYGDYGSYDECFGFNNQDLVVRNIYIESLVSERIVQGDYCYIYITGNTTTATIQYSEVETNEALELNVTIEGLRFSEQSCSLERVEI